MASNALATLKQAALTERTQAVQVADFQEQAALVKRRAEAALPTPAECRERDQKLQFCYEVVTYADRNGVSRKRAAEHIAATRTNYFPELLSAGKKGKSALTYRNVVQWLTLLGKDRRGNIDWNNRDALLPGYRENAVRERRGSPFFWERFAKYYVNRNSLSLAHAYALASEDMRVMGIAKTEWPSKAMVSYHYKHRVDQVALALAREGEEYVKNNFLYFIDRDWDAVRVNEIWFGDHHDLDAPVQVTDENGKLKAVRPVLTAIMDAKSLHMVAYHIDVVPANSWTIQDCLRRGMESEGRRSPETWYFDRGGDYLAKGLTMPVVTGGQEHCVRLACGCELIRALPYEAQAKTIERVLKFVAQWFARCWVGYLGNRPGARPEQASYYWDHPEYLPTLPEMQAVFDWWLHNVYDQHEQDGAILNGKSPAEVWDGREQYRLPMTEAQFEEAFRRPLAQTPQVARGGTIRVSNVIYQSHLLWPFLGRQGDAGKVLIKVDPRDLSRVYAYHLDGRPIGPIERKGKVRARVKTKDERELLAEQIGIKRKQLRAAREQAKMLNPHYMLSPEEHQRLLRDPQGYVIERGPSRQSVKGRDKTFRPMHLVSAGAETADERDNDLPAAVHEPTPAAPAADDYVDSIDMQDDLAAALKKAAAQERDWDQVELGLDASAFPQLKPEDSDGTDEW